MSLPVASPRPRVSSNSSIANQVTAECIHINLQKKFAPWKCWPCTTEQGSQAPQSNQAKVSADQSLAGALQPFEKNRRREGGRGRKILPVVRTAGFIAVLYGLGCSAHPPSHTFLRSVLMNVLPQVAAGSSSPLGLLWRIKTSWTLSPQLMKRS